MGTFNKITIIGYLGSDPTTNEVNGNKVANFNIATNKQYKDAQGNTVEVTTWFRVAAWNRLADIAEKYLWKGYQVYLEGELSTRDYVDNAGANKTTLEVLVSRIHLLQNKDQSERLPKAEHVEKETTDDLPF